MTRSHRDPNLESLASVVQQKQRAKRRPQAASNTGPLIALLLVALVGGATLFVLFVIKGRGGANQTAMNVSDVAKPIADPTAATDVKPIQAVSNLGTTVAAEEPAVVVTVVSANVGPVKLFPVKKQKAAPTTTSTSKLFGQIPEPENQKTSDPLLAIRVRIQNRSGASIKYSSWNASAPILADEAKNIYAFYQFNEYVPQGRLQGPTTVAPNGTIEDVLMFERPAATIRSLDLRLPGQNVGAPQPILISLSPSQIAGL